MEAPAYLDTHVVVWLYDGLVELLGGGALGILRSGGLRVAPIVRLELDFLHEIGRLRQPGMAYLSDLRDRLGLAICDLPYEAVVQAASGLAWTRDPFDRLVTAQAAVTGAPLVTKDARIRANYPGAVWD